MLVNGSLEFRNKGAGIYTLPAAESASRMKWRIIPNWQKGLRHRGSREMMFYSEAATKPISR